MISHSWSIKLSQQPQFSTLCRIPQPTVVYQGVSNQLIAHTNNESINLPIRKQLVALSSLPTNQILILTRYQLSCWDLLNNNEVFTKQFQNAQKLFVSDCYIYVVCASDLFCYSFSGQQQFVSHMSSNIMSLQYYNSKNGQQIILGLQDMSMLRYKNVNIQFDYGKVVGTPVALCWIQNGIMVGTQEGPIAYYESKKSKWKAKSTSCVFKIVNYKKDENSNILVVRSNGSIQLRNWQSGENIQKVKFGEPLINIQFYDYRNQNFNQIICVGKSGNIKAYNFNQEVQKQEKNGKEFGDQIKKQIQKIDELKTQKATLQYEIAQLEKQLSQQTDQPSGDQPILSQNFKFQAMLDYKDGLILKLTCSQGYISGLSFQQPIMPVQIQKSTTLTYKFANQNKIAGQVNCQALVHSSFRAKSFQIKTFRVTLPKFWKWGLVTQLQSQIKGSVKFNLVQRNARYLKWIKECFFINLTQQEITKMQNSPLLQIRFVNSYQNLQMEFNFKSKQGKVQIRCNLIEVLGQIIQDLADYTGTKQLDSQLQFPDEKQKLKQILDNIQKLSQTKTSISSQMAQAINNIKFLLVKGQSARLVNDISNLRKSYGQVMTQNKNLLIQIQKKNKNTSNLSDSLKALGQFINKTSNTRYGKAKETIINQCRQAIKKKDFHRIISIMERGMSAI